MRQNCSVSNGVLTHLSLLYVVISLLLLASPNLPAADGKAAPEDRDQIVVQIHGPKAEAVERTVAAFVAEGLHVAKSEEGIVTAVPVAVTLQEGMFKGMLVGNITYSATVIGLNDTSSEVVLGATMTNPGTSEIKIISSDMTKHWSREKDKAKYGAMYAPFWQRLERIAGRLQSKQQEPTDKLIGSRRTGPAIGGRGSEMASSLELA